MAACRRTTARPRASTSSPLTRETPTRKPISGSSTHGRGGLPKDDREAARLFELAADQGNADAQANLGFFYERPWRPAEGRARGRAPLQARRRQGKRRRPTQLGFFYDHGRGGLPKDDREAARLYKLAADQGNATAQKKLGNWLVNNFLSDGEWAVLVGLKGGFPVRMEC